MRSLTAAELRGNWATLLLPINSAESIDFSLLATEVDHFIAVRVDGIYSNGSAGEFHTQSENEFDRISALLAEKCERAGMPFQIGACHPSAQTSLDRLRRARDFRPAAIQIVLPDWFPPAWPEVVAFLEKMCAAAAPVPLVLYNPPHAKRRLAPEEWREISERFPGIVGIKVPGGDDTWYRAMQPVFTRLSVFIPGHTLATGLTRGAHGAYSNVACLNPTGAQQWSDLCATDLAAGRRWEERIARFWQTHIATLISEHGLSNMAADKAAAAAGGWLPGFSPRLRWPYRSASAEAIARIASAARESFPEWFG